MDKLSQKFEQDKKWICISLIATFIWGMAAHGYVFLDSNFSHDSLREFHAEILGNEIKLGSGRILTPIYRELIGSDVTLPWLAGLLSLIWISAAVFLVIRIFCIESKTIAFLVAGIFTTNISVSSTAATYIHDLDCYMFSMLCSVIAVYLWKRLASGWILGAIPITISLGIYQSFLFVTVTLVMIVCIMELLNGTLFKKVFLSGLKAIVMILLGGALYYLTMKFFLQMSGIALFTGEYNSLDVMTTLTPIRIGQLIVSAYQDCFAHLFYPYSSYPAMIIKGITLFLGLISVVAVAAGVMDKRMQLAEKLLCIVLVALLPLGMNLIHVLTAGGEHDLMTYPIWLFYLLVILQSDWLSRKCEGFIHHWIPNLFRGQSVLCLLLMFLMLYGNVRFSNGMYMKKDLEHEAYLSLMTRVVGRMEGLEQYIPGETPVVFVGLPENLNKVIPGFKDYWNVTAMTDSDVIYAPERSRFQAYFDYVMGVPILLADSEVWTYVIMQEGVRQMPCYPAKGFQEFCNGVLVVKLGEVHNSEMVSYYDA